MAITVETFFRLADRDDRDRRHWQAANLLIRRHGDDAEIKAARKATYARPK